MYNIEESIDLNNDRTFIFWGNVRTLTKDGRVFALNYLKNKSTLLNVPDDISLDSLNLGKLKVLNKKGENIYKINDEFDNIYYEITGLI